jgi:hypothetical protein
LEVAAPHPRLGALLSGSPATDTVTIHRLFKQTISNYITIIVYKNNRINYFCSKKQKRFISFAEIVYVDFYDRVKQLAKERKDLSLQEFVLSIGLNHDSYYSLKRAGNLPRADDAIKISQALDTTVEYLCTGSNTSKPDTAPIIAHLEAVIDDLKSL